MADDQQSSSEMNKFRKRRPKDFLSESTFRIRKEEGLIKEANALVFDKTIIHTDPKACELANDILNGQTTRKQKKRFIKCALAVIANLHKLYLKNLESPHHSPMKIPLNKNKYNNLSKVGLGHISGTYLSSILDYLDGNNCVMIIGGFNDRENHGKNSKVTRVYLKPKLEWILRKCSPLNIQSCLLQKQLIKMSQEDESGNKVISYPTKPKKTVEPMQLNLEKINEVNRSCGVSIDTAQLLFAFMERIEKDLGIITKYDQEDIEYLVDDYFPMNQDDSGEDDPIDYPYTFLDTQNRQLHIHTYKTMNIPSSITINSSHNHHNTLTLPHPYHAFSITKSLSTKDVENKGVEASTIHSLIQRFMKYMTLKDSNGQIDLTPFIAYTRNFSRGSFECGGRFYGSAVVEMPKQLRKFLQINGEATVELDFKSMHLRMLYQQKGVTDLRDDLYGDSGKFPRNLIKMAVNMLLNAKDVMAAKRALFDDEKCLCSWEECGEVIDWVLTGHDIIKEYLGSDMGVRLQRLDSDIAERVMLHFANLGEACFGVHDSFIVRGELEGQLRQAMHDAYVDIIGAKPVID